MASSYSATIESLFALQRHGVILGLETIRSLLRSLDDPQKRFRSLHVGGTNGKGSTAAMVASILEAAGYRVGLYTSPHLVDVRERFRIQGHCLSEKRLLELIETVQSAVPTGCSPTFFEFVTAMAFQYFAEERVDMAVVEVGMGGRFDATNVLEPMGVVITNVSFDHEAYLGDSLSAIAGEKAGIIKRHVPAIVGQMSEEAMAVIDRTVRDSSSPCYRFGVDFHIEDHGTDTFDYRGLQNGFPNLSCSLVGHHQLVNAACALGLLESVAHEGIQVSETAIRKGLGTVHWEGRLETLSLAPLIFLDGAHNSAAAQALSRYLEEMSHRAGGKKILVIVGMMRDKSHSQFLQPIGRVADILIFTEIDSPRTATARDLHDSLGYYRQQVYLTSHLQEAWELANRIAASSDIICVTGSLFLVGQMKCFLGGRAFISVRG